ncbi:MAG: PmoA family protein [Bacteroidota bacterium]|nr:PmoA family protein [Bacteroidota bacterium]
MKKRSVVLWGLGMILSLSALHAQDRIRVQKDPLRQKIAVTVGKQPFTEFIFTDTMEKPFLYPILAPNGQTITRGFPWNPQPNDPTDHPHHIGLWFNYENVNGLDFWNNSYNIPAEKKPQYGWIRTQKILETVSGAKGKLVYLANWTDQQKNILLTEKTTYTFSVIDGNRVIDRATELVAVQDVSFPDVKDGMLGLRVAHELELPVLETKEYRDDKGIVTKVKATKDASVTGNYLTSEGKQGDAAWGTRGNWCMLYGKKGGDTISIVMIDHPGNIGYPTYWHARNYGLFSANPLGQKVFSQGKQILNFALAKGKRTSFRYRVVIASGKERLPMDVLNRLVYDFEEQK